MSAYRDSMRRRFATGADLPVEVRAPVFPSHVGLGLGLGIQSKAEYMRAVEQIDSFYESINSHANEMPHDFLVRWAPVLKIWKDAKAEIDAGGKIVGTPGAAEAETAMWDHAAPFAAEMMAHIPSYRPPGFSPQPEGGLDHTIEAVTTLVKFGALSFFGYQLIKFIREARQ